MSNFCGLPSGVLRQRPLSSLKFNLHRFIIVHFRNSCLNNVNCFTLEYPQCIHVPSSFSIKFRNPVTVLWKFLVPVQLPTLLPTAFNLVNGAQIIYCKIKREWNSSTAQVPSFVVSTHSNICIHVFIYICNRLCTSTLYLITVVLSHVLRSAS